MNCGMKKFLCYVLFPCLLLLLLWGQGVGYLRSVSSLQDIEAANLSAARDSLRILRDHNRRLYVEKSSYISSIQDLRRVNKDLSDKLSDLQSRLRQRIHSGAALQVELRDTILCRDTIMYRADSLVSIVYSDEVIEASGTLQLTDTMCVLQDFRYSVHLPLEVYFTRDRRVIARSPSDAVSISSLESFVSPDLYTRATVRRRWGVGLQLGVGLGVSRSAHLDYRLTPIPYIGIGVTYQIWQW